LTQFIPVERQEASIGSTLNLSRFQAAFFITRRTRSASQWQSSWHARSSIPRGLPGLLLGIWAIRSEVDFPKGAAAATAEKVSLPKSLLDDAEKTESFRQSTFSGLPSDGPCVPQGRGGCGT